VRLSPYQLRYDGEWHVDAGSLDDALTSGGTHPRAILAIHPNNPTGHYLKAAELSLLIDRCRRHDLALISDEVFYEHRLDEAREPGPRLATVDGCLCFSLGGISKLAGLPQLKLGWVAVSGPPKAVSAALARLELIADTALSVSAPVQLALPYILEGSQAFVATAGVRLRRNLATLDRAIAGTPSSRLRCEGGWTAMLRLPATRTSEEWALRILECSGVLVQPGYFYDLGRPMNPDAYVVLSLLCT